MTSLDPPQVDVEAAGKLSEALEWVERARGHLYEFHQLSGHADLVLQEAITMLEDAGHEGLAQRLTAELLGRDVLPQRWTFQIVEEYDAGYWSAFRKVEAAVRDELVGGRRHVLEAQMKRQEQRRARAASALAGEALEQGKGDRPVEDQVS